MVKYPNEYDTFRRVKGRDLTIGEPGDIILPSDHNDFADAIETIERILGITPQGTYQTIAERLEAIEQILRAGGISMIIKYYEITEDIEQYIQNNPIVLTSIQVDANKTTAFYLKLITQYYILEAPPGRPYKIEIYIDDTKIEEYSYTESAGTTIKKSFEIINKIQQGQHNIKIQMISDHAYKIRMSAASEPNDEYARSILVGVEIS
jgi:hypothetical protein